MGTDKEEMGVSVGQFSAIDLRGVDLGEFDLSFWCDAD